MSSLSYYLSSGETFYIGVALVILGALFSLLIEGVVVRIVSRLTAVLGIVAIASSSTAMNELLFSCWILAIVFSLFLQGIGAFRRGKTCLLSKVLVVILSVAALFSQLSYRSTPALPTASFDRFCLIADSISAGLHEEETTWPELFSKQHGVKIMDFSQGGETLSSALPKAHQIPPSAGLVLLEIGGNDLLGRSPIDNFEADLEALLGVVCTGRREVVMFELPLPPLFTSYGEVQRKLARKHGVFLIPKHFFARALGGQGNTVDGLHLSLKGHQEMADIVWQILGDSLKAN